MCDNLTKEDELIPVKTLEADFGKGGVRPYLLFGSWLLHRKLNYLITQQIYIIFKRLKIEVQQSSGICNKCHHVTSLFNSLQLEIPFSEEFWDWWADWYWLQTFRTQHFISNIYLIKQLSLILKTFHQNLANIFEKESIMSQ